MQKTTLLGDQETQAAAHVGDENHCQTAIELYTQLGDQQHAEWVERNCK
jgi:hypothetical protein